MSISITSILSLVFWGNLIILFTCIISRIPSVFNKMNCQFMIWLLCITFLRFLLPGEIKYSITIRISRTFANIIRFIRTHPVLIGSHTVYLYQILLGIWIFGAFILLIHFIWKYSRFRTNIRQLLEDAETIPISRPLDCNFPKELAIYENRGVSAPLITGILKPTIILPHLPLSQKELSFVLDHELQHYKYRDLLLKICMECFCILYWWNPFMHLLKKQVLLLLEMRADSEACAKLTDIERISYLECLKKLCACQSESSVFEAAFAEARKKSIILKRAKYLVYEKQTKLPLGIAVIFSFLLLCSLVIIIEPASFEGPSGKGNGFELAEDAYIIKYPDNTHALYFGEKFMGFIEDPYTEDPYEDSISDLPIYENSREGRVIRKGESEIPSYVFTTPVLFILLLCACISPELRRRKSTR